MKYSDLRSSAQLIMLPEFAGLMSPHIVRFLISEAVDCYARSEDIADHWFRSGISMDVASRYLGMLDEREMPPVVLHVVANCGRDVVASLWKWTYCSCLRSPPMVSRWEMLSCALRSMSESRMAAGNVRLPVSPGNAPRDFEGNT